MTWTPLPLGPAIDVTITTSKRNVVVSLGPLAARRLGYDEDESPNVGAYLGDGQDIGWLRIALDEDGVSPEIVEGRLLLTLPRSALPDLQDCRGAPLTWKPDDGAILVRLPTVAAAARSAPRLASVSGRPAEPVEPTLDVIAVPQLYTTLHASAWANGVELMFLSDGNVSVNGRMMPADDVEAEEAEHRPGAARQEKQACHQPAEQQRAHQHGKAGFAQGPVRDQQCLKEWLVGLKRGVYVAHEGIL